MRNRLKARRESVQYDFSWGDGSSSNWLTVGTTSASHSWSSSGIYSVTAQARCSVTTSVVSPVSSALSVAIGSVTQPSTPNGPTSGAPNSSYTYTTGGSTCSLGDSVQYDFSWGDGSSSSWLTVGTTSASHSWSSSGVYSVTAQARCSVTTSVVSPVSNGFSVAIGSVTQPSTPNGPTSGALNTSYTYTTGGSTCSVPGESVAYDFFWGDGSSSNWLTVGTTSASQDSGSVCGSYSSSSPRNSGGRLSTGGGSPSGAAYSPSENRAPSPGMSSPTAQRHRSRSGETQDNSFTRWPAMSDGPSGERTVRPPSSSASYPANAAASAASRCP